MYINYDQVVKENEGLQTCLNCNHGAVCGIYMLLFKVTEDMREYAELVLRFEHKLYKTLASNCRRYEEYQR